MEIPLSTFSLKKLLSYLWSYTESKNDSMLHVVSANPENMVLAYYDSKFRRIYDHCEVIIVDGVGVYVAAKLAGLMVNRITGVDALEHIVKFYNERSEFEKQKYKVLLVGGGPGIADKVSQVLLKTYRNVVFETYKLPNMNIKSAYQLDLNFAKFVRKFKPTLIFIALGSPKQEVFIETHRSLLSGVICVGVGGAFDMLAGAVRRAPKVLRILGLEWLWRLVREPWRIRRQTALLQFVYLALTKKIYFIEKLTKI